ncbi:hypothetical protein GCM10025876_06260 [Demequina litorisediminis]|uniref:IclR-ED domain-containing protein n=1 Tax=Demequina litorisediminis TaxID=1849022 RepID=A0ABQ6I9A0_9MICO|nr:hypothetical protein GCM10025876_06260 [Demequina litorisediminis]
MTAGSAAQVLLAWAEPERMHTALAAAVFSAADLDRVRNRGYAESAGERESGVSSVSAPVWGTAGTVIAAVSISGPIDRLTNHPAGEHADAVVDAARQLSDVLRRTEH